MLQRGLWIFWVHSPSKVDNVGRDLLTNILHVNEVLLALLYAGIDGHEVGIAVSPWFAIKLLSRQEAPALIGSNLKTLLEEQQLRQWIVRMRLVKAKQLLIFARFVIAILSFSICRNHWAYAWTPVGWLLSRNAHSPFPMIRSR